MLDGDATDGFSLADYLLSSNLVPVRQESRSDDERSHDIANLSRSDSCGWNFQLIEYVRWQHPLPQAYK